MKGAPAAGVDIEQDNLVEVREGRAAGLEGSTGGGRAGGREGGREGEMECKTRERRIPYSQEGEVSLLSRSTPFLEN